jgi:hypothetical protein
MTFEQLDKVRSYFTVFVSEFCDGLQKVLERDLSFPGL